MHEVTATIDIAAPPEVVWGLLSDPHRYPELAEPTQRMVSVPEGPLRVGAVYREYGGLGPFRAESEWHVTEYEPVRHQVHDGDDGSMRYHLVIDIDPSDGGSRLTQQLALTAEGRMKPVSTVLWPLFMRRLAQQAMDKTVANVKAAAESATTA